MEQLQQFVQILKFTNLQVQVLLQLLVGNACGSNNVDYLVVAGGGAGGGGGGDITVVAEVQEV